MLQVIFYGCRPLNARFIKEAIKEAALTVEFIDSVAKEDDSESTERIKLIISSDTPRSSVEAASKIILKFMPKCRLETIDSKKQFNFD